VDRLIWHISDRIYFFPDTISYKALIRDRVRDEGKSPHIISRRKGNHKVDSTLERKKSYKSQNIVEGILFQSNIRMIRTVSGTNSRKEKSKEVIDFCNGSDRRTRVIRDGFLIYSNRRGESSDFLDTHIITPISDDHTSIGREALEISPLSCCIDRIECEGWLPRARNTRDNNEFILRDLERDIFEIMRTRSNDRKGFRHEAYKNEQLLNH
jgi:hypothetical protein